MAKKSRQQIQAAWSNLRQRQATKATRPAREESSDTDRLIAQYEAQNQAALASRQSAIRAQSEQARGQARAITQANVGALGVMGARTGRSQYAPEIQQGILGAEETAGLKRLQDIDAQELSLIAEAEGAANDRNYQLLTQKIALAEEKRREKAQALKEQLDYEETENRKREELQQKATREQAIVSLFEQGITNPVQAFNLLNFDEEGNAVGDISLDEIVGLQNKAFPKEDSTIVEIYDPQTKTMRKRAIPKTFVGDIGETESPEAVALRQSELRQAGLTERKTEAEISKLAAEIAAAKSGIGSIKDALELEDKYGAAYSRQDEPQRFSKINNAFSLIKASYAGKSDEASVKKAIENKTVNDQSAITVGFQLARMRNPDATRTLDNGEIVDADSIKQQASQLTGRILKGNKVLPDKFAEAVREAELLYEASSKSIKDFNQRFQSRLSDRGLGDKLSLLYQEPTESISGPSYAQETRNGMIQTANAATTPFVITVPSGELDLSLFEQ